jgi:ATP adenylyltransferase
MMAPLADLDAIDALRERALVQGALEPIETRMIACEDEGLPFVVKWLSTLATKAQLKKPARRSGHNPFATPEPALTLGPLPPHHTALLNKYPVMAGHLLIVTRDYEAQEAALNGADFTALAQVMGARGGLGFYNGGEIAGASQGHKHLQWIPRLPPLAAELPALRQRLGDRLDFRNAYAALPPAIWDAPDCGEQLAVRYRALLAACALVDGEDGPPPYNLLLTRDWMWLIPRRAESWRDMSINALGFAGSLFVKHPDKLEALLEAGPMNALRAVTLPAGD